ncbi:MAG: response regulator transcription factor [Opitutaceae bacterium]|nr:response regulator transcription factor [Opitutaceae bacterium]
MPTPPTATGPRIGIVEDQALVLSLLADLCRHRFGWNVVLCAKSATEATEKLKTVKPDAMLVDINLPDEDGITLSLGIKRAHPSMRIIVLSAECTEYTIYRVKQSGLDGYVDKNSDPDFIQDALLTVIRDGRTFFSPVVREIERVRAADSLAFSKILSDREHDLLPHIGMGLSDQKVGELKGISSETVRKHRENIMRKLGLSSISELVHYCIEKGFVQTRPNGDVRPAQWPPPNSS